MNGFTLVEERDGLLNMSAEILKSAIGVKTSLGQRLVPQFAQAKTVKQTDASVDEADNSTASSAAATGLVGLHCM